MVGKQLGNSSKTRRNAADNTDRTGHSPIYRSLDPSDITQLQKIYPEIVIDLKESFSRLKNSNYQWRLVKKEERRIQKALASMMPLVTVKSSIFLLRGLEPTIFTLFFEILPLNDPWLIQNAPDSHYILLRLAHTYAQTHEQFFVNSEIFTSFIGTNPKATHASSSFEQLTNKYFAQILNAITKLFNHLYLLSAQAQCTIVTWLQQITTFITEQLHAIKKVREIFALRLEMLNVIFNLHRFKLSEQRKNFVKCIYRLQAFDLLHYEEPHCQELCNHFINNLIQCAGELNVEQFRIVWTRIPITFLIKLFGLIDGHVTSHKALSDYTKAPRSIALPSALNQPQLGRLNMEAFEFQSIATFIFERKCISMILDTSKNQNWIQLTAELFYRNLYDENNKLTPTKTNQSAQNMAVLSEQQALLKKDENEDEWKHQTILHHWQFIIGQFALFCIANRMRTPIGQNPLETFTKFENELRSLVAQTALQKSLTQKLNEHTHSLSSPSKQQHYPLDVDSICTHSTSEIEETEEESLTKEDRNRELRPEEEWFRVRMLLYSIDCIDKLMSYAMHGSMHEIASNIPLNSSQFFLLNKTSCTDWLTRTALPLMAVAFSNGNYAQIVRFAGGIFAELQKKYPDSDIQIRLDSSTLLVICWLIRALVEMGEPQAIRGVRNWAETIFGTNQQSFEWCKYAEMLAAARVEEALEGFLQVSNTTHIVQSMSQLNIAEENRTAKMHDHVIKAVEEMSWRAASVLKNPQIEQKLHSTYTRKKTAITVDNFSTLQWQRVFALSAWDQFNTNATGNPSAENIFLPWESHGQLIDIEDKILQLYKLRQQNFMYERINTTEALYALQDGLSDMAQLMLLAGTEHIDGLNHARYAFLHSLCTGIQHLYQQKGPAYQQQYSSNKQQQMRSPIKQAQNSGLPILLEFELSELLHNWKSETLHRLELGQTYCSWMQRLYGAQKEHTFILQKMHREMAQLAQETGNTQIASLHFRFAGINIDGNRPPNDVFYALQPSLSTSPPPGFAPLIMNEQHSRGINFQQMLPIFEEIPSSHSGFPTSPSLSGISLQTSANRININQIATLPADNSHHILLSEEFDGNTLKLLPTESAIMLQFGINIFTENGKKLEMFIGISSIYYEFCEVVRQAFRITDIEAAPILIALDQPAFQQFWLNIKHRQYRLYELALNSHLRFLENLFPGKSHVQTIEVVFRLLKMLRQQPEWFIRIVHVAGADEMNNWMDRIAIDAWTGVIPQLFAHLNHQKEIVRNVISLLLDKIGHYLPHAICYPAIVIADKSNKKMTTFFDDILSIGIKMKNEIGDQNLASVDVVNKEGSIFDGLDNLHMFGNSTEKTASHSHMVECCRTLVNSLSGSHPKLITDTQAFCRALQRIALLHEEQWLYILGQFDHQISKFLRILPPQPIIEQNGSIQNTHKQYQRIHLYLAKVLTSLRRLYICTCNASILESENERLFSAEFAEQIRIALDTLEEQNLAGNPRKAWEPFKKILSTLNKQAIKRSSLCLTVPRLSSYLSELESVAVSIPGQEQIPYSEVITIQKMAKIAYVLPTKTRPKKIAFTGSDGKIYTFLFKGQENLYMDSRLMQLLNVCNAIFGDDKNQLQMDTHPLYRCVTYTVTPLGQHSGLIQWVDGAIPLFQIYRKWRIRQWKLLAEIEDNKQQKIVSAQQQHKTPKGQRKCAGLININCATDGQTNQQDFSVKNQKTVDTEPERPIEQYYKNLKKVFTANGITKEQLADRQRWPQKLVKQVFKELVEETPKDILAKELWMHSATSTAWWAMTQQFARTAAVSSMLGALIGLGDRHLDNVLLNFNTGQIIHVDYNVCFDKGRSLRVPEMVPFRLTGNIAHALGPTEIEGTFRQSSERVVEMLRTDKQVLFQLLETFHFDPMLNFSFLYATPDMVDKSQSEMAASVVHQIHQKLLGYVLMHRRDHIEKGKADQFQQSAPGMFKLAVMTAMNGDNTGEAEPSKEEANSKSADWIESHQMNVAEQVDLLIQQAKNMDNLALMYEGWTAWV